MIAISDILASRLFTRSNVFCAWCGRPKGYTRGLEHPSHGICGSCSQTLLWQSLEELGNVHDAGNDDAARDEKPAAASNPEGLDLRNAA